MLAELARTRPGVVRIAVDGPPCAGPGTLADSVAELLRDGGRAAAHVPAEGFWRDRSLRLEYGREDADGYASWLDARAMRREVLEPVSDSHSFLPSLRDPVTDRSIRAEPEMLGADGVLIVSGPLLLGLGLPFEVSVHLLVSPAARTRRTPAELAWTLPAFDAYDREVRPAEQADVVVKLDDPRHPAVRGL